jgi:putative ATPase
MADDLFDTAPTAGRPLADRLRPRTLDEVLGQQHLLAPGKPLRVAIEADLPRSMIFWGPPGPGLFKISGWALFSTPGHPAPDGTAE